MRSIKAILPYFFLLCIAYVFVFGIIGQHVIDADTWYHTKSGEIFATKGIVYKDVFSNFANKREWIPFEWLFQIGLYEYVHAFGLQHLNFFVLFFTFLQLSVLYLLLQKIFTLKSSLSFILCIAYLEATQSFYTARTQIVAVILFIAIVQLILLYIVKKKNILWASIPISLLWANMHASVVLDSLLFFGFATLLVFGKVFLKQNYDLKQAKILALFGLGNLLITLLPPVGYLQYVLVGQYLQNKDVIAKFVFEWGPLLTAPSRLYPYVIASGIVALLGFAVFYKKLPKDYVLYIPFAAMVLAGFSAIRNTLYGYFALFVLAGWILSFVKIPGKLKPLTYIGCSLLVFVLLGQVFYKQMYPEPPILTAYPVHAMQFIKNAHIKGNMFNEYSFGGYLLYNLYPTHTVFIDGRMDPYMCCELYDYQSLYDNKYMPDDQYHKLLNNLWDKYNISYILIKTTPNTYTTKVSHILTQDPNWNLVYWDDQSEIFVRLDGKNKDLLLQDQTQAATPFEDDPFIKGKEDKAYLEYSKMITITDSAVSRNALGLLLWQKKNYAVAKEQFEKALTFNPTFSAPYINLAAIYTSEKLYDQALSMYQKAVTLDPTRGVIYIRLGDLYANFYGNKQKATDIWTQGLNQAATLDDRQALEKLLQNN